MAKGPAAAAVIATLAIAVLTLTPGGGTGEHAAITLVPTGYRGAADAFANVLLFVPLGAALAGLRPGWRVPVLAGIALSLLIEIVQLAVPGRYTSPWDVVFNGVGTAAGVALIRHRRAWLEPPLLRRRVLGVPAFGGALAALVGGTLLFRPAPPDRALYGQWTARFGDMAPYEGRVLEAFVDTLRIPSRRVRDSGALRTALAEGAAIRVRFEAGPPPEDLAPVFSIFDDRAQGVMLLGADGSDLVFRYRMAATALRLDEPDVRVRDALIDVADGDTVDLRIRSGDGWCFGLAGSERCGYGLTPGDTWGLILYPVPAALMGPLRLLWIIALFVPAGFWLPRRDAVLLAIVAVAAVALVPRGVGVLPAPPLQLAAVIVGLALGLAIGSGVRRRGAG